MAVDDPVKVIRYGRHEYTLHEAEADGAITAGDVIVEQDGGATVARATSATQNDMFYVAVDDRERGMELGDDYEDGESVQYIAPSGGGLNVLLADGETMDPTSETSLILGDTAGKVDVYVDADDSAVDVLFEADTTDTVEADGADEPIPVKVV